MADQMVPVTMFLMAGLALIAQAYFRFRQRKEQQLTLRELLSSGQNVSADTVDALMAGFLPAPEADLRRGLFGIVLGIAVVVLALVLDVEEAHRPLLGASAFPFLIGLAYVTLWWMKRRNNQD